MPRIAILGAGGMGKTSLAKAVLHHTEIMVTYAQNRFFVTCTSATTELELVNLIGAHLGLKPGKDLTQAVLQHFSNNLPSLLILDELETLWESATSCKDIEELLLLLTGIREFVQKLHEPQAAFVYCAKPHVAPCGFCLPINYVFKTCISVLSMLLALIPASCRKRSVENGLFRQHHSHSRTAVVEKPNNDIKNDAHHVW
jgi:hypothetical protein